MSHVVSNRTIDYHMQAIGFLEYILSILCISLQVLIRAAHMSAPVVPQYVFKHVISLIAIKSLPTSFSIHCRCYCHGLLLHTKHHSDCTHIKILSQML